MGSKKLGRPKSLNPKNIDVKVRLDSSTSEKLEEYAKSNNTTRAGAIRQGIELILDQNK